MSSTSAWSSGVSNASTLFETSTRRGSPIRTTGLTAIERHHEVDDLVHPRERLARDRVDIRHPDAFGAVLASRRIIHRHGDGRVAEAELASERRFGHPCH